MKKILFLAASAILLAAGCQKTEVLNQAIGDPMTFSTGMGKLTKADSDPVATQELKDQGFKTWVYAAYADTDNNIQIGSVYDSMSGLDVTFDKGKNAWVTINEYFWPSNKNNLDFYAVSTKRWDYDETNDDLDINVTVSQVQKGENDLPTEIYTTSMNVTGYKVDPNDATDDLMISNFLRANSDSHAKSVPLHFKHALSKVRFAFNTNVTTDAEDEVFVTSLKVSKLVTAGTLAVRQDTDALSLEWSPSTEEDDAVDFTANYASNNKLQNGDPVEFTSWLVLPQDITGVMATIGYTINERSFNYNFKLAIGNVTEWDCNQIITYNINLSPNKITFAPVVDPWEEVDDMTTNN